MTSKSDRRVDARGLLCPLPTVKASLALEEMAGGELLELASDDPVTRTDLTAWCRESGHTVARIEDHKDHFSIFIRKGRNK